MSHRWKLFIAVAVVMLALTIVWVVTMRVTADSDVDAYRKSLIASGEKLEIAEVMPPPVPVEQNGADVLNGAFRLFTSAGDDFTNQPPAMLMAARGKAVVCFAQWDVRGSDFTNSWSNVMDVVAADRPATELLKQAANFPAIDFHVEYAKWPETLLTHLAPLKRSAQRLSAEAMCDLHEGDAASAATNICAMLALVRGEQGERTLISQLIRIAVAAIATGPTWELLQSTNVNESELAMVQTNWERLEYVTAMENALLMERAGEEVTIKKMRESSEYFNRRISMWPGAAGASGSGPDFWDSVKLAGAIFMWQSSWSYSDELRMLQNDQVILQTIRAMQTNACYYPAFTNLQGRLGISVTNSSWDDIMAKMDEDGLQRMFSGQSQLLVGAIRRVILAEVNKRAVITAIALKRYQLKQGNYPANLSELVPEFLDSVPLDPMDGKPLRYRLKTDGTFLLYSIGDNNTDDGGDASLSPGVIGANFYWLNPHALDWVWPQPATAAEIEYYFTHPKR